MDSNFLKKLSEGTTVEFKRCSTKLPVSFWENYSSFANTEGGTIYLGIVEKKNAENEIVGVTNHDQICKDIINTANNSSKVSRNLLSPNDIQVIDIDGSKVISVYIRPASRDEKPVYLNGNPYLAYRRINDADQLLTSNAVLSYLNDSASGGFDLLANTKGIKFADLNKNSLVSYRKRFALAHPGHPFLTMDDETFFSHIGAVNKQGEDLVPTNAGVLCFGKNFDICKIYPSYQLDYRVKQFLESKRQSRLTSDDLTFSGNLYDFFELVTMNLRPLLPAPYYLEVDTDVGRNIYYQAVQEAILNALFNADYNLSNAVSIVFDGRTVTIENSGTLRIPLPLALQGGHSDPRNKGVTSLFRLVNLGDRAGSGIPTMFMNLAKINNLKPIYKIDNVMMSTSVEIIFGKALEKVTENIFAYISQHSLEGVSSSDIADTFDLSRYKVNECLKELLDANLIKDNGKTTKGRLFFQTK